MSRVAILGTGKMGAAAARRLASEGFDVRLWNRTRARAEALGVGSVFDTPGGAVDDSPVALSILTGPDAVRDVYGKLDPRGDRVYLEMSTAGPEVPEELSRRFHRLIAAPVIAPPHVVAAGKALFIAGGPEDAIEEAMPVFKALGEVRSVGTHRRAAAMKLMNNTMLAITAAAGAEMVEAGVRSGLNHEEAFEWVKRHAPYLETRQSVYLGGAAPTESYLNLERIMKAAMDSGSEAIHPGYGFLSERPAFPEACEAAGIAFIGPTAEAMIRLGDKLGARALAKEHGVPTTPGTEAISDHDAARKAALEIGLPVIIKPSGGGGGIGMKVVEREQDLVAAIQSASNAARSAFGDA